MECFDDLIASVNIGKPEIPFPEILTHKNIPDSITAISEDQVYLLHLTSLRQLHSRTVACAKNKLN